MPFLFNVIVSAGSTILTALFAGISKIFKIMLGYGLGVIFARLGTAYIIFEGFGIVLDQTHAIIVDYFSYLPTQILAIFGLLGLDTAINIIFTAYVTRFLINNVYNSFRKINLVGTSQ